MRAASRLGEDMENVKRLTCGDAVRQFFAYLDRALSGESLENLDAHLAACLDCCEKLEFSRKLDAFAKERLGDAALPEGIEERIRRAVRGS